ncbi:MAG: hypothetical protein V9H26_10440 [Verrucomicrobiota bacterium]
MSDGGALHRIQDVKAGLDELRDEAGTPTPQEWMKIFQFDSAGG